MDALALDALVDTLGGDNLTVLRCLRQRALSQSHPIFVVGGPVRDILIGAPIRDLDFVVEGDGPEVARWLAEQLGGEVRVHPRFGTSTFILGSCRVDVVTARSETYSAPAALPTVTPGSIFDDLARRDFTINSLALPLNQQNPKILDLHGGIDDLRSRVIRILHPKSFEDDPTRIFRAIRYEQRFGFELEPDTLQCLNDAVDQGHLASLTSDRIKHELEKILEDDQPEEALKRCAALGVLAEIYPAMGRVEAVDRLVALTSVGVSPSSILDITGSKADAKQIDPLSYIGALAYPLSEIQAEELIRRINANSVWAAVIRDVVSLKTQEELLAAEELSNSQLAKALDGKRAQAILAVTRLTGLSIISERLALYSEKLRHIATELTARKLIDLGVPQGPAIGRLLDELREAKLDGLVLDEEDEIRWLQERIE